jgi:predicted RNase H-like HicB family nuclease
MSGKSQNSRKAIDCPFDRTVLDQARRIAGRYQIILQFEDGEYFGRGLEMPFVMGDGKTPDACVRATREALTIAVATLLELDESPPSPASENKRSEQINVRVTPDEKLLLEQAARTHGFRGIGDYVRSKSLARSGIKS